MQTVHDHWDAAFADERADSLGWFEAEPNVSLRFAEAAKILHDTPVIDAGAGVSKLVLRLHELGYTNLTAVDVSETALDKNREAMGEAAGDINWIVGDLREIETLPECGLWHDRAVFHFLTEAADRARYLDLVNRTLRPGGSLVLATFGPAGPEQCSGLPVVRYGADSLAAEFGAGFDPVKCEIVTHTTPSGGSQQFLFTLFRKPAV